MINTTRHMETLAQSINDMEVEHDRIESTLRERQRLFEGYKEAVGMLGKIGMLSTCNRLGLKVNGRPYDARHSRDILQLALHDREYRQSGMRELKAHLQKLREDIDAERLQLLELAMESVLNIPELLSL